ncbi:MAG: hypothetical protein NTV95_04500 [Candidatus Saccharibacteria bacterium]|nr:hypothetical protein [Candidatus Saccharibacteria bacterium]
MSTETIPRPDIQPIKPEDITPEAIHAPIDPEVAEEVGEVAVDSAANAAEGPANIEISGREHIYPEVAEDVGEVAVNSTLDTLRSPEAIEKRVGEALVKVDFEETPQMKEALTQYFETNYALASTIDKSIAEDPKTLSEEQKTERQAELQSIIEASKDGGLDTQHLYEAMVEYGNMPPAITRIATPLLAKVRLERIANPEDSKLECVEQMLLVQCGISLFSEASVGVTSVGEEETKIVKDISSRVKSVVTESPHFDETGRVVHPGFIKRDLPIRLLDSPTASIDDATKLFWEDVRHAGQLLFHNSSDMTRTRANGEILTRRMQQQRNEEVQVQTAEALDGHMHSPTVHWSEKYDPSGYKGETDTGGTIALPIREVIASAPFARDAEYGVLRMKQDRKAQVVGRVTSSRGIGNINGGPSDTQGIGGIDRTFYSSPIDSTPGAPLEQAPDAHGFKLSKNDFAIAMNAQELQTAQLSGVGESFPQIVQLDYNLIPETVTIEERTEQMAEREKSLNTGIDTLQQTSIDRYPDEFVIPVRAGGVFNFFVPDDSESKGRERAQFTKVAV